MIKVTTKLNLPIKLSFKIKKKMKNITFILLILFLSNHNLVPAQNENKQSKLSLIANAGIGFASLENNNEPDYNLNIRTVELLLNYKFKDKKNGIATGIVFSELTGNGFNSIGNFYNTRNTLKIPILFTNHKNLTENISMFSYIGPYAQTILKDEYQYLMNTRDKVYGGWNFGAQLGIGFMFKFYKNYNLGLSYFNQQDFSKIKTNKNAGITDRQKKETDTIGIIFLTNF
jgi:hypothetical protein